MLRAESGRQDYLGAFAVTAGLRRGELVAQFEADHDDYNAIMAKALADRLAEAFAERLHEIARSDWGFGRDENLTIEDLIAEKYRGIRPAPGYPACPDHTEKRTLFDLLEAEPRGSALRTAWRWTRRPRSAGSISPTRGSRYFAVDRLTRDQVEDYARARPSASPTWNALWRPTSATSPRRGEVEKRNRKKKIKELIAGSPPGTPRGVDRRESDVSPAFGLLGLGSSVGRIPGVRLEAVSSRACKRGSRSSVASDPGNPSVAITKTVISVGLIRSSQRAQASCSGDSCLSLRCRLFFQQLIDAAKRNRAEPPFKVTFIESQVLSDFEVGQRIELRGPSFGPFPQTRSRRNASDPGRVASIRVS